jgi:hypothetical protein
MSKEDNGLMGNSIMKICDWPKYVQPDWLWKGYVARGRCTQFNGMAKKGKTTLLATFLGALARGEDHLFDVPLGTLSGALIITEENLEEWSRRRDVMGIPKDSNIWGLEMAGRSPNMDHWEAFLKRIGEICTDNAIDLVVIDPLNTTWPVQAENDAGQVSDATRHVINHLSREHGLAVVLVHHMGKGTGHDISLGALAGRGSSAGGGVVDYVVNYYSVGSSRSNERAMECHGRGDPNERTNYLRLEFKSEKHGFEADHVTGPPDGGDYESDMAVLHMAETKEDGFTIRDLVLILEMPDSTARKCIGRLMRKGKIMEDKYHRRPQRYRRIGYEIPKGPLDTPAKPTLHRTEPIADGVDIWDSNGDGEVEQ